jgi:dihydrolipoamide dehydrogenase
MEKKFDVIIIGGGPGGYVAAIRASQLGLSVAVVEEKHLGGICLNWGCIPTKALLKCSEIYSLLGHADDFGISVGKISYDFAKIIKYSRNVSSKLASGVEHLMKKNNVTVFNSRGKLNGTNKVRLFNNGKSGDDIEAKNIIIATGARSRILPNLEPDDKFIWDYKKAMVPESQPKSLLIVGSGAIGIEFASFYNSFGTKVTIVEMAPRILPVEDTEISAFAQKEFEKQGMSFELNSTVSKVNKKSSNVEVEITNQKTSKKTKITVDRIISAAGIVGNIEDIGIEGCNIKTDRTHIATNKWAQTNEKNIYAIGDVGSAPWLAHKASHEATTVIDKIAGKDAHPLIAENIPGCTYSSPQIASVGLSEDAAKDKKIPIKVGRFPFMANGKAIAIGKETGFIKVIYNSETGELVGAHMIGSDVTELIQGFVLAKTFEATEEDVKRTIFPHPTLSEMMHEATLDADQNALHI